MAGYEEQVSKQLGFNRAEHAKYERNLALNRVDVMHQQIKGEAKTAGVSYIALLTAVNDKVLGGAHIGLMARNNVAFQSAIDRAHKIIKKSSAESGVPHQQFLSLLADKALEAMKGGADLRNSPNSKGDDNFGDDDDGVEDDAGDEVALQGRMHALMPNSQTVGEGDDEEVNAKEDGMSNLLPRRRYYQPSPSPVDRNPESSGFLPRSPSLSQQTALHTQRNVRVPGTDRGLLLNVGQAAYNRAARGNR